MNVGEINGKSLGGQESSSMSLRIV